MEVPAEMRTRLGLGPNDALFNLTVKYGNATERFLNLTVTDNARRIDRVLKAESSLVAWKGTWPNTAPALTATAAAKTAFDTLNTALQANPPNQPAIDAARQAYETAKLDLDDAATKAEKKLAKALAANPQVPGDIATAQAELAAAVAAMKGSNGQPLDQAAYEGSKVNKTGLYALDKADLVQPAVHPAGHA